MAEALRSPTPLRAWWDLASDPRGTALLVELMAAANHRPALKAQLGSFAREVRRLQVEILEDLLGEYGIDADDLPPVLVAAAMQGLAFSRSEEHTSELQSLMRTSYAVFCLQKNTITLYKSNANRE